MEKQRGLSRGDHDAASTKLDQTMPQHCTSNFTLHLSIWQLTSDDKFSSKSPLELSAVTILRSNG